MVAVSLEQSAHRLGVAAKGYLDRGAHHTALTVCDRRDSRGLRAPLAAAPTACSRPSPSTCLSM